MGLPDFTLPSLTIPHLSTPDLHNITWLPTPLAIGATGTALIVAAVLVFLFLKSIRLSAILGAAGGVCLFLCAVAAGYVAMGEDNILPKLKEANTKLEKAYERAAKFANDAFLAQQAATKAVRERNTALAQLKQTLAEAISAQSDAVRNAVVDPVVVRDLGAAITRFNDTAPVARAVEGAAAAATAAGTVTVEHWERWTGEAIELYGQCVSQVRGLQEAYNGIAKAGAANDQLQP